MGKWGNGCAAGAILDDGFWILDCLAAGRRFENRNEKLEIEEQRTKSGTPVRQFSNSSRIGYPSIYLAPTMFISAFMAAV